jgi:hypothetical protein
MAQLYNSCFPISQALFIIMTRRDALEVPQVRLLHSRHQACRSLLQVQHPRYLQSLDSKVYNGLSVSFCHLDVAMCDEWCHDMFKTAPLGRKTTETITAEILKHFQHLWNEGSSGAYCNHSGRCWCLHSEAASDKLHLKRPHVWDRSSLLFFVDLRRCNHW